MVDKTTVVKCGGNAAVQAGLICRDVAALVADGHRVVLVHGGSADIGRISERLGVRRRELVSPDGVTTRYTDAETLDVVTMALAGRTKPRLVSALQQAGVAAIGLTGLDGGLLKAKRVQALRAIIDGRLTLVRDNHAGRIVDVNAELLELLLDAGLVPVVSPPARAEDGRPVNSDADRAAAAVSGALGADTLVMLTGAPGVLTDASDEESVMPVVAVPPRGAPPHVGGGMALKLVAAREALAAGVDRVLIGDGRRTDPVRASLAGESTTVRVDDTPAAGDHHE